MRTAYAKARYESQMESPHEYFRYTAVLDQRTRPSHAKLHGTVLPKNDPFWDTNYPPNGWNCRCKVQVLTKRELERKGITPLADSSMLKNVADKDFAYNPGRVDKIEQIYNQKISKFSNARGTPLQRGFSDAATTGLGSGDAKANDTTSKIFINNVLAKTKDFNHQRDLYVWQRGLDSMVDNISSGNIIKDKNLQIAQVGKINLNIENKLNNLNIKLKTRNIVIYQDAIAHITRNSKPNFKKPNIVEIKAIVDILDKSKHCFYDLEHKNLIFFYNSMQNDNMVNSIAINLNYVLKKFRTDNFIATISKIPMINYKGALKNTKQYIKIK